MGKTRKKKEGAFFFICVIYTLNKDVFNTYDTTSDGNTITDNWTEHFWNEAVVA